MGLSAPSMQNDSFWGRRSFWGQAFASRGHVATLGTCLVVTTCLGVGVPWNYLALNVSSAAIEKPQFKSCRKNRGRKGRASWGMEGQGWRGVPAGAPVGAAVGSVARQPGEGRGFPSVR